MKKKLTALFILPLLAGTLASCQTSNISQEPLIVPVTVKGNNALATVQEESEKYENIFLEDRIPNQWPNYGIGDPFIYRFNGYYYLVCSTKAGQNGVKCWKSTNLMNWEPVDNGVCKKGFIVDTTIKESYDAYASEVYYLDGTFYLVESSNGKGHYVLKSNSPEGPFEVLTTKTIDNQIDGSMFLDVDGQMVLMYAESGNIHAKRFSSDMTSLSDKITIQHTSMSGWTEGPESIIKDGVRYYFYTGNGVTQRAYRIDYSYSFLDGTTTFENLETTQGHNVLLNTDDDFYGLGHGCVFMGPDLDSYYLGYHNSYQEGNDGGRRFNLGRLLFNGTEVSMQHTGLYNNIVPNLPDYQNFDSSTLTSDGDFALSNVDTEGSFTVEYNFKGTGKMVFSYVDQSNYCYASFDGRNVKLYKVDNGTEKSLGQAKAFRDYSLDNLHTVKLGYKDGLIDVWFDNQEISNDIAIGYIKAGKVGYNGFTYKGTLTFNNTAQGDSDKLTEKIENVPASSYDPELSSMSEETGLEATDESYMKGSYQMKLGKSGDYVTYLDYAYQEGSYGLDMVVSNSSFGKQVGIQVDGGDIKTYKIPDYSDVKVIDENTREEKIYDGYAKVKVGDMYLTKGNHNITIYGLDTIQYQTIYIEPNYNVEGVEYNETLKTYPDNGIGYPTFFNKDENGFYTENTARYLCTFGDGRFEDLEMSVDITITGDSGTGTCGIVLAADNWAFNNLDLDNYKSIQGYYFSTTNRYARIIESNYQYTDEQTRDKVTLNKNETYTLKAVKQGKKLKMYINGELILEKFSPFGRTRGYCGIYSNNMAARFNNLHIKTL